MHELTNKHRSLCNEPRRLSAIYGIIEKYPSLVHRSKDAIINQILRKKMWITDDGLDKTCPEHVWRLVDRLMYSPEITTDEYEILTAISRHLVSEALVDSDVCVSKDDSYNAAKAICLALISRDAVIEERYASFRENLDNIIDRFYRWIFDIYIPSYNSEESIFLIKNNIPLSHIVKFADDNAYIMHIYKRYFMHTCVDLKELMIFFKSINDIYENPESALYFLKKVNYLSRVINNVRYDFLKINKQFSRYFPNDELCIEFTNNLMCTLTATGEDKNTAKDFIIDHYGRYGRIIDRKMLQYLLNSLLGIIQSYDEYELLKTSAIGIGNQILYNWGQPQFDVEVPVDESYIDDMEDKDPYSIIKDINTIALEAETDIDDKKSEKNNKIPILNKVTPGKSAAKMSDAEKNIYKAYKTFEKSKDKIAPKINQAGKMIKKAILGDAREEIIEGNKFTPMKLLSQLLGTCALFSIGPIKTVILLVVRHALRKNATESERRKIVMELDTELELLDEKINDAKSDENREAKYCMMRTRKELENARKKIMYGMEADVKSMKDTKNVLKVAKKAEGGDKIEKYQ